MARYIVGGESHMKQSRTSKVLSCLLAVLFPLSMMATSPGAMAVPSGNVAVNGNGLARPAAVFSGDRIDTANGSLSMTMTGSSVLVSPKSSVVYAPDQMTVSSGGVRIATTTGFAGRVRNLSLRPDAKTKSVYTVAERDGKILIAAVQGSLAIDDGRGQMTIAANHAVAIPVSETTQGTDEPKCQKGDKACEKAVKNCKGDKACEAQAASAAGGAAAGGAAAGAAGAGAAAAGASVSTAVAVGVAAAVAAASAAASYGIAVATEPKASSSTP
jgi:hypothetical protein